MPAMYLIISLLLLAYGGYHLLSGESYFIAIHSLLVSLYFYASFFEMRGQAFSRKLYLLLVILFLADGFVNLFYIQGTLLSGVISLVFSYSCWRSYQQLEK